jgi:hypothetical protein
MNSRFGNADEEYGSDKLRSGTLKGQLHDLDLADQFSFKDTNELHK